MNFIYFFIIDISLFVAFTLAEATGNSLSASLLIALQLSTALGTATLAQKMRQQRRFFYYIIAAALLIRGVLDAIELTSSGTFLPKTDDAYLYAAFLIPMLLFCGSLLYYFTETMCRYDSKQMMLDSYKVSAVIITAVGATTLETYNASSNLLWEFSPFCIAFVLHTLASCTLIIFSFILILSERGEKQDIALTGLLLFYLLMASRHILLTWHLGEVVAFNLKVIEYMLAAACITLSATLQYHHKLRTDENLSIFSCELPQPENIGKTKTVLFLVAISIVIWLTGLLSTPVFLLLMFILAILQRMDAIVQRTYSINAQLVEELTIDALTGLQNRSCLIEKLNLYAAEKKAFTFFFVNIVRFKVINNIHGIETGDIVLRKIAGRLAKMQQKHEGLSLFRCSADEFAILMEGDKKEEGEALARLIVNTVESPLNVGKIDLSINVRIGITRYPQHTKSIQELLKYADNAMRKAKQQEDTRFICHSQALSDELKRRVFLEKKMQLPDFTEDLVLYYQPKINVADKKIYELEALVRWFGKDGTPVSSPAEFIPLAERIGKIDEISNWVFTTAFQQIKKWNEAYNTNYIVNVNVSPKTIHNKMFVKNFLEKIGEIGVRSEWIGIEITEYSAMAAPQYMRQLLADISNMGIKIYIDDFGTGYSSLSYLKLFDIDELKIPKELVDNVERGLDDYHIINAIIRMAQGLSLTTVAEGVELKEQLAILEALGCDTIQGYFFEKPLPADKLEERYLKR